MLTVATALGNQWDWLTNPIKTQRIAVSPPAVALGIKHFKMFVNSTLVLFTTVLFDSLQKFGLQITLATVALMDQCLLFKLIKQT